MQSQERAPILLHEAITGTMDELEPILRARGFVAVRTMAGALDLAAFDPYGMRRIGSVNIQSERWAHHVWRGVLASDVTGAYYLTDAKRAEPGSIFVNGLFPLVHETQIESPEYARLGVQDPRD